MLFILHLKILSVSHFLKSKKGLNILLKLFRIPCRYFTRPIFLCWAAKIFKLWLYRLCHWSRNHSRFRWSGRIYKFIISVRIFKILFKGRQYDGDGNLHDWWQESTKKAYLDKAQCIIEQYGNFTESTTGLNLNGVNTQGENIAVGHIESYSHTLLTNFI